MSSVIVIFLPLSHKTFLPLKVFDICICYVLFYLNLLPYCFSETYKELLEEITLSVFIG